MVAADEVAVGDGELVAAGLDEDWVGLGVGDAALDGDADVDAVGLGLGEVAVVGDVDGVGELLGLE